MVNSEILMSLLRKGLIGIPARRLTNISNGAGGNPIFLRCSLLGINTGVSIKYLIGHEKSLTPSFGGRGLRGLQNRLVV